MEKEKQANFEEKKRETENSTNEQLFLNSRVRKSKDKALKLRLKTLIANKGWSESDFYKKLGYSKQVWYAISWGVWEATLKQKIRIAKALETDSTLIWQEKGGENGKE